MKKPCPKVRCHYLAHREATEIEHRLIGVETSPIRRQDHDGLRDGIGDLSQLHFVLPELFFSPLSVFDVGIGSIPVDDIPVLVAQGFGPEQEPPIFSVEASHACLDLARILGGDEFERSIH